MPFLKSFRLNAGLGVLARVNVTFVPSMVPPGVSASTNAALVVGVVEDMKFVNSAESVAMAELSAAKVLLSPVTWLMDIGKVMPPPPVVVPPPPVVVPPPVLPPLVELVRTALMVSGVLLGGTCQVSVQAITPLLL